MAHMCTYINLMIQCVRILELKTVFYHETCEQNFWDVNFYVPYTYKFSWEFRGCAQPQKLNARKLKHHTNFVGNKLLWVFPPTKI